MRVTLPQLVCLVGNVAHMFAVQDIFNVSAMDVDRFDPTPIYKQVAKAIRNRIKSGELQPRDPVPSESKMVSDYDVARDTARRAVALLRSEGWVVTLPQRGTFVSDTPGTPPGT